MSKVVIRRTCEFLDWSEWTGIEIVQFENNTIRFRTQENKVFYEHVLEKGEDVIVFDEGGKKHE